jgi:type 1 glutamine amidotransferase
MQKIKTLLATGQHNHEWTKSSSFCKTLLEDSALFDVTICTDPSTALHDQTFANSFGLFLLDDCGEDWCDAAKHNFEAAVASGAGLVVLHGSGVGFKGWVEFEKMAGLLWRDGTDHGNFQEFKVDIVDQEHPITKGISSFMQWDELYYRMVNVHNVPVRVLASAYSDPEIKRWDGQGGSGANEPVMITNQYGKGRIFYQILGHAWPIDYGSGFKGHTLIAFENENFKKTLLRGCEWAATGTVTETF